MKKAIPIIVIITVVAIGVAIYVNHASGNMLSEQEASGIAIETVKNDTSYTNWADPRCAIASIVEKDTSVMKFNVNKTDCDKGQIPGEYITSVIVNLKTGEAYTHSMQFNPDQESVTVRIEGKDYYVDKKYR